WYGFCAQNHRKACAVNSKEYPEMLKVIDCRTRRIIEAPPNCSYAALSYVWGKQKSTMVSSSVSTGKNSGHCTLLSLTMPSVISDAIIVTLELGLQYLWVDRYCIDQNDEKKHFQINQMDKVYLCAVITIVAAAGENADYGLPGVSDTLRRAQPYAVVRGQLLASTMRSSPVAIRSSRWATRGWTYQEAALSRKRLVFTDDQVFFECKGMSCSE
ncbi:heterokaryon incompatibility protein-domain-containing protein, partial [Usnea florida]